MTNVISRPFIVAAALSAGLALGACETSQPQNSGAGDDPLNDTAWLAEDIEGVKAADNVQSTLEIALGHRVTGSGGCNSYFGLAVIEGDKFSMGPVGSTKMACPDVMMAQEQRFLDALAKVHSFKIDGGELYLYDEQGGSLLRLSEMSGG